VIKRLDLDLPHPLSCDVEQRRDTRQRQVSAFSDVERTRLGQLCDVDLAKIELDRAVDRVDVEVEVMATRHERARVELSCRGVDPPKRSALRASPRAYERLDRKQSLTLGEVGAGDSANVQRTRDGRLYIRPSIALQWGQRCGRRQSGGSTKHPCHVTWFSMRGSVTV
jgi:hypothetical protein